MLIPSRPLDRRQLLRGAGKVAIALPLLQAMQPSTGRASDASVSADGSRTEQSPKRFVAICAGLGFHGPHLFPSSAGDLSGTPYLDEVRDNWDRMTLFSGLSHPEQQGNNGHASSLTFLTSAQRPGLAGFRNTISLDQLIASKVGLATRFPYLTLSTSGQSLSWTAGGVPIPGVSSPAKLFKSLFAPNSSDDRAAEITKLRRGRSILDTVGGRAENLEQRLGNQDRMKLDEYLSAVRELEQRLVQSEAWVHRPKPTVDREMPDDIHDKLMAIERQSLMYDMIALALQTDSARTITLSLGGLNAAPKIPGVQNDWHGLSHHGKDPQKIQELKRIEEAEFQAFNRFLTKLRQIEESGSSLLDQTAILFGSNLGNASAHDWRNLPIILAGGGYRHGRFVQHDSDNNTPLANVFVAMAQRMGVETDRFGSSTAAGIRGLEPSS